MSHPWDPRIPESQNRWGWKRSFSGDRPVHPPARCLRARSLQGSLTRGLRGCEGRRAAGWRLRGAAEGRQRGTRLPGLRARVCRAAEDPELTMVRGGSSWLWKTRSPPWRLLGLWVRVRLAPQGCGGPGARYGGS